MKRDKRVQEIADLSIEHLHNNEFKEKLILESNNGNEAKSSVRRTKRLELKVALSFVLCCIIVVSVLLCTILINKSPSNSGNSGEKFYAYENIYSENVSLGEIEDVLGFTFNCDNVVSSVVAKDKLSDDVLYYGIVWEDEESFISSEIRFITNPNFQNVKIETFETITIEGIEIKMNSSAKYVDDDDFYIHDIYAEMTVNNIKVIVSDYEEWSESEENRFTEFIVSFFAL